MKRCPRCEQVKDDSQFYRNHRDGLSSYCKPCSAAYKRKGQKTKAQLLVDVYPAPGKKVCSKCKQTLDISQFNGKDGERPRPQCKACQYAQYQRWASGRVRRAKGVKPRQEWREDLTRKVFPSPATKVCPRCCVEKSRSEFDRSRKYKSGICPHCKVCRSIESAEWYEKRRDRLLKRRAAYRKENLERVREWARNGQKRRRAAKLGVAVTLTNEEWEQILERYGHKCLCCESNGPLTMDHIVPISRGGPHTADNIQPLCGPCNSRKRRKIIDYRPKMDAA